MNPSKEKKSSEAERFWRTFKKLQETHVAKDLTNHGKKRLFKIQFKTCVGIFGYIVLRGLGKLLLKVNTIIHSYDYIMFFIFSF